MRALFAVLIALLVAFCLASCGKQDAITQASPAAQRLDEAKSQLEAAQTQLMALEQRIAGFASELATAEALVREQEAQIASLHAQEKVFNGRKELPGAVHKHGNRLIKAELEVQQRLLEAAKADINTTRTFRREVEAQRDTQRSAVRALQLRVRAAEAAVAVETERAKLIEVEIETGADSGL